MIKLKDFIENKMRMSHIYQPVMIMTLLEHGGSASEKEIASKILSYDVSQVEYYEKITHGMVGRVLRSHGIVDKHDKQYELIGYDQLSKEDKHKIIQLCETKLAIYFDQRGKRIFEHRRRNRRPVPGSIRYKVLKRAMSRCELCGISHKDKALEVDHIVPKEWGGKDDISNYQALCYTCNSNKGNRDDADFRGMNTIYDHREKKCVFCSSVKVIHENNLAFAIRDKYPVTEGHTLIIPKRHCKEYFDLTQAEINAINDLIRKIKGDYDVKDPLITGYNIGINNGEDAGQTVFHCHVHLIPRRKNDVQKPMGGVRNVISGKGVYP